MNSSGYHEPHISYKFIISTLNKSNRNEKAIQSVKGKQSHSGKTFLEPKIVYSGNGYGVNIFASINKVRFGGSGWIPFREKSELH